MKSSYIEVSEGQLHFLQAGSWVPLLLLHQTSLSSEEYSRVIPLLANDFQVLALDLPGHGKSLQPRSGYRIEDHAKSVLDFLDVLRRIHAPVSPITRRPRNQPFPLPAKQRGARNIKQLADFDGLVPFLRIPF